jgi:hypothetical protein
VARTVRGICGPVESYPGTLTRDEATAILGFDPGPPRAAPETPALAWTVTGVSGGVVTLSADPPRPMRRTRRRRK